MRLKNHDFSFTSVQKILRQITKIRFRCCLLELLKSTLFKTSDCVDQRILSLATSATLYCKSKKQDKSFPMNDDYRILFAAVYDTILLICEDILTGDYPDHYRLAAIESLFFGLKHQQSISKDQLVNSLRLVTCFSIVLADKDMCTWNSEKCDNSNMSYELLKKSIEGVISENELANKVLKDNLIEVDGDDDPYLNTKPMIHNAVYMYLTNLASLLPCLSAYILHRILEIVVTNNALFIFTMPTKISLTLIKIVEKIIVICQADVRVPIHFFGNFLTFLTVLNNSSYREKIEKAFADCSELQPTSKEVFAVYLQLAKADVAEELGQAYSTLWETLKTKYIFLVGMSDIKKFMSQISRRLQDLSRELESQVFTTEFDTFEVRSKSNESSGLNELKFEKLKSKQEPVLMSTKDLTKSKLEYLKNFRDIFGELEYYLELIDCITANLKEKVLIFNHVPEPLKDGEANLDQVSKKLISNFSSSGMQILNSMDAKFWETSNDMALKVQHFLKTFLRDSVFIDYFQSTWVILCSFLSIREPVRNEKINSLLYVVLREIEERPGAQQSLVHSHTLKSLHYLLEYTSKFVHVHYDDKINDLLVRVLSKLLIQVRHTQNSELVRLIRFLISKFPDVITDESIPDLFTFFLEPYFDLESENAIKLVDQLLDICSKKQEKDDIFASLIQILVCSGSTAAAQKDNMDRRMQILAKRHKKAKHILTTKVSQQQVIDDSMKKLKILHKVLERADSKLLVELVRLSYLEASSSGKSRGMSDLHSDNGNLILGFLLSCVQLQDPNLDLLTIGICVMLLQRIKPSSSYPSKSSVTICDFVLRNIKTLCNRPFLEAQSQHELLVCCLLIFSEHLPPAPFEVEVSM